VNDNSREKCPDNARISNRAYLRSPIIIEKTQLLIDTVAVLLVMRLIERFIEILIPRSPQLDVTWHHDILGTCHAHRLRFALIETDRR
jgi:hypothetical protein